MGPIGELLARARWDAAFRAADFEVAWHEHDAAALRRVPLTQVGFEPGDHALYYRLEACSVPLHRVSELYRNGVLIWRRGPPWRRAAPQ